MELFAQLEGEFFVASGERDPFKSSGSGNPTYYMSVFQLPLSLCNEINGLMQKF